MNDEPTRKLGKYEIIEQIGSGGFATVFKARDTTLDRIVALKVLRPELLRDPIFVQRFEAEARMAAQLEHANIVRVYEVGVFQSTRFLAMEFIDGQSLAQTLSTHGRLTTSQAVRIIRDVAAGLDVAHAKGLVHRDIKPSNILIRKDGTALITDFGIAKAVAASFAASLSSTGQILGTLLYMSPEQAEEQPVNRRADVYSLGVVLFEMVTGRPPFQGETAIQLIRAHADKLPPPPSDFNKAITPAVESVILRALAKEPGQRFPSAGLMARALEAAARGQSSAKPVAPAAARRAPVQSTSSARKQAPPASVKSHRGGLWLAVSALVVLCLTLSTLGAVTKGFGLLSSKMETPIVSVATTRPPATLTLTQNAVEPTETLPPQPTATSQTEKVKPPDGESLVAVMETPEASPETVPTMAPLEPTAAAPGGAKAIGTAYEVEGVSLSLTDYHIESDGRIGLVFTVANQGKSKVLLRYQNTYFSVSDDTGRTYPQTERNLMDPKQAELEAGASYSMTSNDYPDRHDRIGYFTGMVSEGATYLLVKVSQLAGLRDLLWSIPLNAQAASPQTPVAGSVQQLRDEFSASGISVSLSSLDIESSGQIGLKFIVRNEGNSPVLLRYQNKYFEVKDDLGNTYAQTERNLLDPKQFLLEPGSSYEITSNSYPDRYSQIGYFLGKVPEGANQLVVRISQFADLRDMQWTIPLNALLRSSQTPSPGSQQPVLEGFSANGISVFLSSFDIESSGQIGLKFIVRNEGNNPVLLRYQNKYLEVKDDLGNTYTQTERNLLDLKQYLLEPGSSYEIISNSYPERYSQIGYFLGMIPEGANQLVVRISQFADLRDMQWTIPLKALLISPQTPSPGSQQPVLEGFSANGISVSLSSLDIESSGQIGLKFIVRNEGNNPVLLRYQNKYFEVKDDLGNTYAQTERNLLDPKQFLLEPGSSYEVTSNSYPERYSQIGYFLGKVPEGANQLVVRISQFADLHDLQWWIPLK